MLTPDEPQNELLTVLNKRAAVMSKKIFEVLTEEEVYVDRFYV